MRCKLPEATEKMRFIDAEVLYFIMQIDSLR